VCRALVLTASTSRYASRVCDSEYDRFLQLLKEESPDTLVHFAEQRAAPYSMKNALTKRYTIENNLGATHNVLCAIVDSGLDIHLVHLGTMGVYGYGNSGGQIPEGYIDVILPGNREKKILHPAYPGSIYHATKCLDALLFQFYAKNDMLRLTDLHQGIVWGTNTKNTAMDERLCNRFDYDVAATTPAARTRAPPRALVAQPPFPPPIAQPPFPPPSPPPITPAVHRALRGTPALLHGSGMRSATVHPPTTRGCVRVARSTFAACVLRVCPC
jgi:nucleoside-diphosphate-sugar epimerase